MKPKLPLFALTAALLAAQTGAVFAGYSPANAPAAVPSDAAALVLIDSDDDDDENEGGEGKFWGSLFGSDDDDDEGDDDDDGCATGTNAANPGGCAAVAPGANPNAAPPANGLFGTTKAPTVQIN